MKLRLFAFLIPGLITVGCATEEVDNERMENRAAAFGSCVPDDCGGQSTSGSCYCDSLCSFYGDCCDNYEATCDGDDPLPEPELDLCLQDSGCDAGEVCDMSVCHSNCPDGMICPAVCWGECVESEQQFCGGFAGIECPEGQVCVDDPNDGCDPANGGADCGGFCEDAPAQELCLNDDACNAGEVCDMSVCLSNCPDGMICPAVCWGECVESEQQFCGGFAGIECPEGQVCVDNPNDDCDPANGGADCGGFCEDAPEPDPNSCEGSCGEQAAGGCWCDDLCSVYGDCCDDVEVACNGGTECGDEVCSANEACVTNYTQLGPNRRCEPVDASCDGTASCDCMGDVCEAPFDTCSTDEQTGGLACYCIAC